MTEERNLGRPTAYNEQYCGMLITHMAQGLTKESFAGEIGVTRRTLYYWRDAYPEFAEAMEIGAVKTLLFYERLLASSAEGKAGNVGAIIFGLKNRAAAVEKSLWVDVSRREVTGKDGLALSPPSKIDMSSLTDEQLRAIASIRLLDE